MTLNEQSVARSRFQSLITIVGIAWGIVSFLFGIVTSFTFNSVHPIESLAVLVCGLLIILPIAIIAIWKPYLAAFSLAVGIAIAICSVCVAEGYGDGMRIMLRLGLPNILLVAAYAYNGFTLSSRRER